MLVGEVDDQVYVLGDLQVVDLEFFVVCSKLNWRFLQVNGGVYIGGVCVGDLFDVEGGFEQSGLSVGLGKSVVENGLGQL